MERCPVTADSRHRFWGPNDVPSRCYFCGQKAQDKLGVTGLGPPNLDPVEKSYVDMADINRAAQNERLRAAWPSLFPSIEHGDAEHRAWLKAKLEAWFEAVINP